MQGRNHPNLVRLHELFAVDNYWCFTMDQIDGVRFDHWVLGNQRIDNGTSATQSTRDSHSASETFAPADDTTQATKAPSYDAAPLSTRVGRLGSAQPKLFHEARLRESLCQLVQGVLDLHAAGVLHRDLKPSNVLVEPSGKLLILDFGLALNHQQGEPHELSTAGTPAYMSPEQARGSQLTMASDWYSVGVILYEALTGRLPFGGTSADMIQARRTRDPRDPRQLVTNAPDDLCDLCMSLLKREPVERPSGSAICAQVGLAPSLAASPHHFAGGMFVGREAELAALNHAFEETKKGGTVVAHVHGPSGLGKTTLVQKFISQVRLSDDLVVLEGRCYERESVPFKALDDLVDALGRYLESLRPVEAAGLMPRDTRALVRLFPSLGRLEFLSELPGRPASSDIHELRRRAFIALRDLLARISDTRPLILVLEDVHWGDRDSADLVRNLLAPPDVPRALLIASYRDEAAEENVLLRTLRSPQAVDSAWQSVDVDLGPLPRDEAKRLAQILLGDADNAEEQAQLIAEESAQNPLFVAQLVRAAGRKTSRGPDISMKGVVLERTQQLPHEALHLLRVLSVCNGRLTEEQLVRSAGLKASIVPPALDQLRDEQLAVVSTARSQPEFEVVHDKVRQATLSECQGEDLRQLHLSLARMYEDFKGEADIIAHHFLEAQDEVTALKWLTIAGDRAADGAAFDLAVTSYQQAQELCEDAQKLEILEKLAQALSRAGQGVESAVTYLKLAELDQSHHSTHLRQAGEQYLLAGHAQESLETLDELLHKHHLTLPPSGKSAVASLLLRRARLKFRGYAHQETQACDLDQEKIEGVDLCWTLGHGLAGIDLIRSAYYNTLGVWLALELGEPRRIARALALDATLRSLEGMDNVRSAQPILAHAEELAHRLNDTHAMGWVTAARAVAAWTRTEFDACEDLCREAIRLLREDSEATFREIGSITVWFMLHAAFLRGNLAFVGQHAPAVAREAEARGDRYTLSTIRPYVLALHWAVQGQPEQARLEADQAIAVWPQDTWYHQHWAHLRAHCFLDLYEGKGENIIERTESGRRRMKATFQLRIRTPRLELTYLEGRGLLDLCLLEGFNGKRHRLLKKKIADLQREENRLATIYARCLQAALSVYASSMRSSGTFLQLSTHFAELGMPMHEQAALMRHGELEGNESGNELARMAAISLRSMGVTDPVRFASMLVPRMKINSEATFA